MKKIDNKFFDLISLILSFFTSLYRSFLLMIGRKKEVKRGIFFKSMDYVFRGWPQYFWKKPNLLKIGMFLPFFIKYIFYNKNKDEK